jgi:hypothetical protein
MTRPLFLKWFSETLLNAGRYRGAVYRVELPPI